MKNIWFLMSIALTMAITVSCKKKDISVSIGKNKKLSFNCK